MKPALAFRQPHYPKSWQSLPNGELILSAINEQLAPWWPKFFGYYLLKIGALSGAISCDDSPIPQHITLSQQSRPQAGAEDELSDGRDGQRDIIADIDDLPLLKQSVDVCVLSHALEFSLDPHHVVREANRVLMPNGYLVITGFNPFSLAGLNKLIPYRKNKNPWNERFFSPMRVKDWLHLMGYEIIADQRCLHHSLATNLKPGKIRGYWQRFADNYLTSLGSVYVIIAKKRVLPLTPIKPKWQLRPSFQPVKVSTMNSNLLNSRLPKQRNK
ncbi:methyltransferase domain-containing protein [Thalassomonas viridans]|uniref:Methyltransferase domain-containing protein n=1 Tax=Thalassomonas viridans TaxID=137584 RepID=A0AAE9YYY2_9GAMM|nr:class I SAM-dependent methyltransferase [Thalassomonas viridans]WDE02964.1 methyltransferase domain-containing protein [Thalassomonas viridans]